MIHGRPNTLHRPLLRRARLRRAGIALAAVCVAATGSALVAAPAAEAASRPGWAPEWSTLVGINPSGFKVYVNPHVSGYRSLAAQSSAIAAELRRFRIPVTYAGYGTPRASTGIITVSADSRGCSTASEGATDAVTYPITTALPSNRKYISAAIIVVCPRFLTSASSASLGAALRHEFGHAVGLAHTAYSYRGRYQIMYPGLHSNIRDYQAGDQAGLRWAAAGVARVKAALAPLGRLDPSTYNAGRITLTGWAFNRYAPTTRVLVTVTDNGRRVYSATAATARPDVDRAYKITGNHGYSYVFAWTGGTHKYCVSVTRSGTSITGTLGCVTWKS